MKKNNTSDMEAKIQKNVGVKLRELRKSRKMSALELSQQTDISQGQISKIENGKATISIRILSQLCHFFNRPLNYLFQEKDEIPHVLGTINSGEGPESEGIKWFSNDLRQATSNQMSLIRLEPYHLGTPANQVSYLKNGVIDLFIEDLCLLVDMVRDVNVFALPYIFSSIETHLAFLNGSYFKDTIQKPLLEHGVRFLNPQWNWHRGESRVLISKQPIFSPEDIKGLKVRIFDSDVLKEYWENLGAKPIPVPWEDTVNALKKGQIDVMPCYKALVHPLKFCRYAGYVTEIGDISSVQCVCMNESKYQLLAPDIQSALQSSCDKAGDFYTRKVKQMAKSDELLNIKDFKAAYIKTDHNLWKGELDKTRKNLIKNGIVSKEIFQEIDKIETSKT